MKLGDHWLRCRALPLAVSLIVLLVSQSTAAFKYLREGMIAPTISGTDIVSGTSINSEEWLGNNLVVVVFWASWSDRSRDQLGDLVLFVNEHPELRCRVVAVNVDGESLSALEREQVIRVVTELNPPFPVILDEGLELFYRYGVIAVPSTAII